MKEEEFKMAIRTYIENDKKLYEVYVNGFNASGMRVQRKRRGLLTLRKAETVEFELKRELAKLKEKDVPYRWGEWLNECLGMMKMSYRPSTLYSYETTLNKWVTPLWREAELNQITKKDVHELIYERLPQAKTLHTRKYVLKLIKRVLQMAVDHGKLDRNPCQGLMIKVPEADKLVLTNDEAKLFLTEAKITNHRFYPIWLMALFTGMRSGELYALRWCDVDLVAGTISVTRSWSSKNGYTTTKTQKTRVVPIGSELLAFLKEYKLMRSKEEFVLPHLNEWSRGDGANVTR